MSTNHTGNLQPSIDAEEHDTKNTSVKKVGLFGYDSTTDEYGRVSIGPQNELVSASPSLDLQVDDTGTYTYLGNATPGTATSASSWRIKRVVNATGVITHADGSSNFDKEWDERATYTY